MKCFTVFDFKIYDGIPVVDGGIGLDGHMAKIADGIVFPKPFLCFNDTALPPFNPAPKSLIFRADYFQYKDHQGLGYVPVIFSDFSESSGRALVLWITKIDDPIYFTDRWSSIRTEHLLGPIFRGEYVQYLFRMDNDDSSVMVKPKESIIILGYSRGELKINKTPK